MAGSSRTAERAQHLCDDAADRVRLLRHNGVAECLQPLLSLPAIFRDARRLVFVLRFAGTDGPSVGGEVHSAGNPMSISTHAGFSAAAAAICDAHARTCTFSDSCLSCPRAA